jgi:hypothetical protein
MCVMVLLLCCSEWEQVLVSTCRNTDWQRRLRVGRLIRETPRFLVEVVGATENARILFAVGVDDGCQLLVDRFR